MFFFWIKVGSADAMFLNTIWIISEKKFHNFDLNYPIYL